MSIVVASTTCAATFVQLLKVDPARFMDAFLELISSSSASGPLFSAVYAEVYADRFVFDAPTVDTLLARMPMAVAQCTGFSRCQDWKTYVLDQLLIGELYACPPVAGLSEAELLGVVPYGSYTCIESVSGALAVHATQSTITSLLTIVAQHQNGWSRRNALRVLANLGMMGTGSVAGQLVIVTSAAPVTQGVFDRLINDADENVLHDAIYVLDAIFFPYPAMAGRLLAMSTSAIFSSALRFRAAAAWSRLLEDGTGPLAATDVTALLTMLQTDDPWVRAQAAFTIEVLDPSRLTQSLETQLSTALNAGFATETMLQAKVYMARALDALNGTQLAADLKRDYEAQHLGQSVDAGDYAVRTGLDAGSLPEIVELLTVEASTFHALLGPNFASPVPADPNPSMTLIVFATPERYAEYMGAFIGFGANAGGLYIEGEGTLYTYERTPQQSRFTLRELVQHEFGHYLQARFVYPGVWGETGYFTEPKAWADEGFAELLSGLDIAGGTASLGGKPPHVVEICARRPFRSLSSLLSQRAGYDQAGTFDYAYGWSLHYWLMTKEVAAEQALMSAFRSDTYTQATWASIAGFSSLAAAETAWHAELQLWCTNGGPPGPADAVPPRDAAPSLLSRPGRTARGSACREVTRVPGLPQLHAPVGPGCPKTSAGGCALRQTPTAEQRRWLFRASPLRPSTP